MPSVATIATKINGFVLDAPKLDKHVSTSRLTSYRHPNPQNQQWSTIVSHSDVHFRS